MSLPDFKAWMEGALHCPACRAPTTAAVVRHRREALPAGTIRFPFVVTICPDCGHIYAELPNGTLRNLTGDEKRLLPRHHFAPLIREVQEETVRHLIC